MIKTPSFQCWGAGSIPSRRTKIPHVVGGRQLVSSSLETPWSVVCRAPLSMGFSRQEYFSGLPLPSPRDLPDPGIEPVFQEGRSSFLLFQLILSIERKKTQSSNRRKNKIPFMIFLLGSSANHLTSLGLNFLNGTIRGLVFRSGACESYKPFIHSIFKNYHRY